MEYIIIGGWVVFGIIKFMRYAYAMEKEIKELVEKTDKESKGIY